MLRTFPPPPWRFFSLLALERPGRFGRASPPPPGNPPGAPTSPNERPEGHNTRETLPTENSTPPFFPKRSPPRPTVPKNEEVKPPKPLLWPSAEAHNPLVPGPRPSFRVLFRRRRRVPHKMAPPLPTSPQMPRVMFFVCNGPGGLPPAGRRTPPRSSRPRPEKKNPRLPKQPPAQPCQLGAPCFFSLRPNQNEKTRLGLPFREMVTPPRSRRNDMYAVKVPPPPPKVTPPMEAQTVRHPAPPPPPGLFAPRSKKWGTGRAPRTRIELCPGHGGNGLPFSLTSPGTTPAPPGSSYLRDPRKRDSRKWAGQRRTLLPGDRRQTPACCPPPRPHAQNGKDREPTGAPTPRPNRPRPPFQARRPG